MTNPHTFNHEDLELALYYLYKASFNLCPHTLNISNWICDENKPSKNDYQSLINKYYKFPTDWYGYRMSLQYNQYWSMICNIRPELGFNTLYNLLSLNPTTSNIAALYIHLILIRLELQDRNLYGGIDSLRLLAKRYRLPSPIIKAFE